MIQAVERTVDMTDERRQSAVMVAQSTRVRFRKVHSLSRTALQG